MEEDKGGGGGGGGRGGGGEPARVPSGFVKAGERQRFTVELRPGETTIVSWKRLIRDAQKASGSTSAAPEAPANAHPALESRITPVRVQFLSGNGYGWFLFACLVAGKT